MAAADLGQAGATWAVMQYVLGLRQLGHDVVLIEPVSPSALRPVGASLRDSANARYFQAVTHEFALDGSAGLLVTGTRSTIGLSYNDMLRLAGGADLLLNLSGLLRDEDLLERIPVRAYIDLDPAFSQLWHACEGIDMGFDLHNVHVTVGTCIGRGGCDVPTCGIDWLETLPPVVLSGWPGGARIEQDALTTVGNWRAYGCIEHDGVRYGQKAHSLRELVTLPQLTSERLVLALKIHPRERADLARIARYGWRLLDPRAITASPAQYRRFIESSKGELGIAKSGYVISNCGWFSDRSACYLASGRPVIAQDTGFHRVLPTGEGLFSFRTELDAVAAIDEVNRDYPRHAKAARQIAEEMLDSNEVLARLLERIGSHAARRPRI
jgi:hypothetical protein